MLCDNFIELGLGFIRTGPSKFTIAVPIACVNVYAHIFHFAKEVSECLQNQKENEVLMTNLSDNRRQ